jgi:sugar phosphate isomerase/epimerase
MRCIKDIGLDNLGINLDPANLLLYGRGNPIDALDIFKGCIRGVHIKDGDYPTESRDFHYLGSERKVGEGSVNFPVFLPKLLEQGYKGDLYIEREISGEKQTKDIKDTIIYLKKMMG